MSFFTLSGRASTMLAGFSVLFVTAVSTEMAQAVEHDEEPIVVTATRAEQALADSLASVSVIDRAAIELSQAPDLLELLRLQAGVDVARTGGAGDQTSVFMRGANSNHVLVIIDGVRVSASGTGAFAWETLDPATIERIEIVRGPRAARWGSDAIGGVIQIFTRRSEGVSLRAGYGRYRDRSLVAAAGTGSAGITAAARRVGGFSSQNERGFAFDPDKDGFESVSVAGSARQALGAGLLEVSARLATGDNEFDQGESDFLNYAARVAYHTDSSAAWRWQYSLGAARDRLETETAFGESEAITRRVQAGMQTETALGAGSRLLLGVDGWQESGVSRGEWSESRYNIGAWTGLDGRRQALDYEFSLRWDQDELFGSAVTGNLAAGWRINDDFRFLGSLGRGFRAPNFNQLFSPGFFGAFAGNPDLDPETSWSTELGLQWQPSRGQRARLSLFENRIDDLIDFAGENFQAINIREARIRGIELHYAINLQAWRGDVQLTWQDPEDRSSGQDLLRRAREKGGISLDRLWANGAWLGTELVHVGRRFDVGQVRMPSYTLLNLRAGLPLTTGLRLEGRVENLTDRDYEQLFGFNTHRRSLFVAVSWSNY